MAEICTYTNEQLADLLPLPEGDANKYSRGVLMAVVGSARYPGAACLASYASARCGTGYTRVATAPEAVDLVRGFAPSLVVQSFETLHEADLPGWRPGHPAACLVGPGFDTSGQESARLTYFVLEHTEAPVLVDGGALSALTTSTGRRLLRHRFIQGLPTVVTPHAGEAARLADPFDLPTEDPAGLSRLLSLAYGVVAVVKGPQTFISDGEQTICMSEGTAALAKAGTGDVLAGILGSLLAQGLKPLDAAVLGTTLHARAGVAAEEKLTVLAVTAEEVIANIPDAVRTVLHT